MLTLLNLKGSMELTIEVQSQRFLLLTERRLIMSYAGRHKTI